MRSQRAPSHAQVRTHRQLEESLQNGKIVHAVPNAHDSAFGHPCYKARAPFAKGSLQRCCPSLPVLSTAGFGLVFFFATGRYRPLPAAASLSPRTCRTPRGRAPCAQGARHPCPGGAPPVPKGRATRA